MSRISSLNRHLPRSESAAQITQRRTRGLVSLQRPPPALRMAEQAAEYPRWRLRDAAGLPYRHNVRPGSLETDCPHPLDL